MREILGKDPWAKQCDISNALAVDKRVTVVSCNGSGKSTLAGWLCCWFMESRKNALVITTAPTAPQVWNQIWRSLREAYQMAKKPMHGQLLTKRWEFAPQWYAMGMATDKEERYQGPHPSSDGELLVIIDEGSGVKEYVFNAVRGWLTTHNCYVLLIGNGNKSEGSFYESHQRGNWTRFQISAFEVPPHIMDPTFIEEMREHWGEGSPQWQVRVEGRFPSKGSDQQLFPLWLLEQALDNKPTKNLGRHAGVDVARGGTDNNVMVLVEDGILSKMEFWQSADLIPTCEKIAMLANEWDLPVGNLHVEVDNVGGGVVDRLREANVEVDAVQSGGVAIGEHIEYTGQMKFQNRKVELAMAARIMLLQGEAVIPRHMDQVWKDVQRINYLPDDEKGRVVLESKRKLRARTGISPDFADAWFISFSRQGNIPRIFYV